jgi:hypothetical protein
MQSIKKSNISSNDVRGNLQVQLDTPTVPLPNMSFQDDSSNIDSYLEMDRLEKLPAKVSLGDLNKLKLEESKVNLRRSLVKKDEMFAV